MRTIDADSVGQQLLALINEPDPIAEDIGIKDAAGSLIAVVISPASPVSFR